MGFWFMAWEDKMFTAWGNGSTFAQVFVPAFKALAPPSHCGLYEINEEIGPQRSLVREVESSISVHWKTSYLLDDKKERKEIHRLKYPHLRNANNPSK